MHVFHTMTFYKNYIYMVNSMWFDVEFMKQIIVMLKQLEPYFYGSQLSGGLVHNVNKVNGCDLICLLGPTSFIFRFINHIPLTDLEDGYDHGITIVIQWLYPY